MHYLSTLGIHPKIQAYFEPHLRQDNNSIIFNYENDFEHTGPGFHRVPITESCWTAGESTIASCLIISASAMDAITWLHQNRNRYSSLNEFCFISTGSVPYPIHATTIKLYAPNKKLNIIFSNDPTGNICALKLASYIRNKPLKISFKNYSYHIQFEHKNYQFNKLSLNILEKASGYNFLIRSYKPKNAVTYYEQHRNRHPT